MLNSWTDPGLHFMIPFITKVLSILSSTIRFKLPSRPIRSPTSLYSSIDEVRHQQRSDVELPKSWSSEPTSQGPCARDHQKLHSDIRSDLDLQQNTVCFQRFSHEINQFCSSHTVQDVLIDKFNTLDETLKESLQQGCKEWAPGIESKTPSMQSSQWESPNPQFPTP